MFRRTLKKIFATLPPARRTVRVYRRRMSLAGAPRHYVVHKERARALVHQKLEKWNAHYQHSYKRVAIRNQKSRWGSCSTKGNLNFHYRIVDLPSHLQDYIIVHELCHLVHFNHSKKFWDLVAETLPDHTLHREQLRAYILPRYTRP